ncbi:NAD(P)H-binding protein [Actinoplanes sp. LDG1-06]|uniref:NAD(P)H-binding protein n=1 Tax=Paractinoplanes ovalisporus TaxID=2810368 RepID=A0ABS2A727_9ACTN|nr:NAD(P)H-binding protein [Actinoplanes ovalisporus]MBM2615633.1 NAD(P)H-binding protein [Actinoplanes ovalisporus]
MRMAVAGGTGMVGRHVVALAREAGHEVVVISRADGVDLTTGAGLDEALTGVDAVIDVTNIETLSRRKAIDFFETTTRTLLAAEERSHVRHHVVLSIVGVDRVDSGYYAGKRRQEELALAGPVPATVLRATQFHEFAAQMLGRVPGPVKVVPAMLSRPVAASEVAAELVRLAEGPAQGRATDLAGPEVLKMPAMVRRLVPGRLVLTVPAGRAMSGGGLLPVGDFRRGEVTFDEWLAAR